MSDRVWTAALLYPAPLYAALFVLAGFSGNGIGVTVGFLLVLGFGSATALGVLRLPAWVWLGRLLFVLAVLVPLATYPGGGGAWIDLAAGVVIGSPFLWLEYAWRDASSPAARVMALQSTFLVGILSLATLAAASSVTGGSSGWRFFEGLGQVIIGQIQGIDAVLTGGTPNGIPLESTFDVAYAALGGVALLGVVLTGMYPHTARDEPLPWSWVSFRPSPIPLAAASDELGLRPGQREVLVTRTRPTSPETVLPPGLGSLVIAGVLVAGFIAVAVDAPSYALLLLVLGTVGALFAVALILARRLTPLGGLEG